MAENEVNFYEELGLDASLSTAQLREAVEAEQTSLKRRVAAGGGTDEDDAKLSLLEGAAEVFQSDASRDAYDNGLLPKIAMSDVDSELQDHADQVKKFLDDGELSYAHQELLDETLGDYNASRIMNVDNVSIRTICKLMWAVIRVRSRVSRVKSLDGESGAKIAERYNGAINRLEFKGHKTDANDPEFHYLRGCDYRYQDKPFEKTVEEFDRAIELEGDNPTWISASAHLLVAEMLKDEYQRPQLLTANLEKDERVEAQWQKAELEASFAEQEPILDEVDNRCAAALATKKLSTSNQNVAKKFQEFVAQERAIWNERLALLTKKASTPSMKEIAFVAAFSLCVSLLLISFLPGFLKNNSVITFVLAAAGVIYGVKTYKNVWKH